MIRLRNILFLLLVFLCFYDPAVAQRVPVLNQIDLPHNYYFRELYLPQLTSGPSSLTWSPQGEALIFPMAGSLWLHTLDSGRSLQLTDGQGYDYQPDWSPDGRRVVFTRYNGSSMELMLVDLETKKIVELTKNGAVNLEPKWSPNGQTLAFVSTHESGHFLLFTAQVKSDVLTNLECLTPDRMSETKRYYYSPYDHSINPTWSPDGDHLYFVSNKEIAHGTGDIVAMALAKKGSTRTIRHEETSWRTSPDISPDGTRIVYSSYLGRNWHQLWLLPVDGGYPVPLTYGDYDNTDPKWSPDGKRIAFISNRTGNPSLWLIDVFNGKEMKLNLGDYEYQNPINTLRLLIRDENGHPTSARVSLTDSRGKFYAPMDARVLADDSRYPEEFEFEQHYFYADGECDLIVPKDQIDITINKGPEYEISKVQFDATGALKGPVEVQLKSLALPQDFGNYWNGDLHVHMNYGGKYRSSPKTLIDQANAEDLNFVYNLIVNKEQRIPDIPYFSPDPDPSSNGDIMIFHAQEFHTSYWGHMALLHLDEHFIIPDYSGYPLTAVSSLFPHNPYVAKAARNQNALVGYVHPFLGSQLYPQQSESLTNDLPVNAALGLIDYYELIGFADHIPSADVWYKLLNCGLRIPAGAGTDAMANYSSLRGPIGLNRVYIKADGSLTAKKISEGLKAGNGFVTNGPLIGLEVDGAGPGDVVLLNAGKQNVSYKALLRSSVPVNFLEIIWNGRMIAHHNLDGEQKSIDIAGSFEIEGPGWMLARAWSNEAHSDIFDIYPYASTNPIYFEKAGQALKSISAAEYFITWIDRLIKKSGSKTFYRNDVEWKIVKGDLEIARRFYEECLENATIE